MIDHSIAGSIVKWRATLVRLPLWCVCAPFALVAATAASGQDNCRDILQFGVEETEVASTQREARRLYRWACDEQASSEQATSGGSVTLGYDMFSLGAKNNSSSITEYRERHCSLSEDDVAAQAARSFRQRSVNPEVVAAWSACIEQTGVHLQPKLDPDQTVASFSIRYDQNQLAQAPVLRGISSGTFACTTAGGGEAIGVGGEPRTISSSENLNIRCNRESEISHIGDREVRRYSRDTLLLDLSSGGHRIDFAERREGPALDEFADLQERMSTLVSQWESLAARVEAVNDRFGRLDLMLTRRTRLDSDCGTSLNDSSSAPGCPSGWIDTDTTFTNSWLGGKCGYGTHFRLCIRARADD